MSVTFMVNCHRRYELDSFFEVTIYRLIDVCKNDGIDVMNYFMYLDYRPIDTIVLFMVF